MDVHPARMDVHYGFANLALRPTFLPLHFDILGVVWGLPVLVFVCTGHHVKTTYTPALQYIRDMFVLAFGML